MARRDGKVREQWWNHRDLEARVVKICESLNLTKGRDEMTFGV